MVTSRKKAKIFGGRVSRQWSVRVPHIVPENVTLSLVELFPSLSVVLRFSQCVYWSGVMKQINEHRELVS